MSKINLSNLRTALTNSEKNRKDRFARVYEKLALRQDLTQSEEEYILRVLGLFFLRGDEDVQQMAYSMALNYGLIKNDFLVLKEFANLLRYYPVSMLIEYLNKTQDEAPPSMDDLFSRSLAEVYKESGTGKEKGYYRSEQQFRLGRSVDSESNLAVIAPTSYGKSHLMIRKAVAKFREGLSVCVVVPTKSLMNQTVSMVREEKGNRRGVITHPDMYSEARYKSRSFIAVLTQERLVALLAKYENLRFDYLFIDEAHNLFKDEDRALVLARATMIANNRGEDVRTDFFSPFINSPESSLRFVGSEVEERSISAYKITEHMKVPRYFLWREKEKQEDLRLFDQFTNRFYPTSKRFDSYQQLLKERGGNKNIIYVNKPSDVERFADSLANVMSSVEYSEDSKDKIDDACRAMSEYVHEKYNLIKLLKHGIAISHGKMPDIIKDHVEYLYRKVPEIKFIVTTSTLLEGVNVPASKLFMMSYSKGRPNLSISDFKNLVGRVGRFSNIFNYNDPKIELLAPEIYIIENEKYMGKQSNAESFMKNWAKEGLTAEDSISNPLLVGPEGAGKDEERLEREASVLANLDQSRADSYSHISDSRPKIAQTELGRSCFTHNITVFNVLVHEEEIHGRVVRLSDSKMIDSGETLLDKVISIFLDITDAGKEIDEYRYGNWIYLLRRQLDIRNIYAGIINKRVGATNSFSGLVASNISRWRNRVGEPVYVGRMGSCDKNGKVDCSWRWTYHIFNQRSQHLMPSYAAALAKENLDNIDYYIIPFLEVLNDFGVVEDSFYKRIKYGTDDDFIIILVRAGLDLGLAKMIGEDGALKGFIKIQEEIPVCPDKEGFLMVMREKNIPLMYINSVEELL